MRVLKLLHGEIDMLQNDLPPELLADLEERTDLEVIRAPGSNFAYIGFQLEDPATGNALVRKAIAHAIDREAIIKYVFNAGARPATALLPPEHWAGHAGLTAVKRDLVKAGNLLAQAGYSTARPLRLNYKTSSDPFRVRIATILQQQLRDVGIEVDVQSYDWGTFYGDIKAGRFQMYSLAWVGIRFRTFFATLFTVSHCRLTAPIGAASATDG